MSTFTELCDRCRLVQHDDGERRVTQQQPGLTIRIPIEVRIENGKIVKDESGS